MEKIRCLIADMPQMLLADIVQKIIEARPGIEIIGRIGGNGKLPQHMLDRTIDVVIYSMEEAKRPHVIDDLLKVSPHMVSVGLEKCGRHVCVCVDDIGADELVRLIEEMTKSRAHIMSKK